MSPTQNYDELNDSGEKNTEQKKTTQWDKSQPGLHRN
jgi:hypothetical protein